MTNPLLKPILKPSLQRFLNRRYISICAAIFVLFSLLVSYMNYLGMDETSAYYMQYEAQVLSEHYSPYNDIIEFDKDIKEYYWGVEQLPQKYQWLFEEQSPAPNKVSLYSQPSRDIYILPYIIEQAPGIFYVIHLFENDNVAANNRKVHKQVTLAGGLLLLCLCFYIFRLNRRVIEPVDALHQWVEQLAQQKLLQQPPSAIPSSLRFAELEKTATALHQSLEKQHQLHASEQDVLQREKAFLSTLSHELRTPMAIIGAALAVLEKRNELPPQSAAVLGKLHKANHTMKQLTDTLLQLWRRQQSSQPAQSIHLAKVIQQAIEECREQYQPSELDIQTSLVSQPVFKAQPVLIQIVVNNLLRNACQYGVSGEGGQITVSTHATGMTISNPCSDMGDGMGGDDNAQYGFGLGLYLVEAICEQVGWDFTVRSDGQVFAVEVKV